MPHPRWRRLAPLSLLAVPVLVIPVLTRSGSASPVGASAPEAASVAAAAAAVPAVPAAAHGVAFGTSMGDDPTKTVKMFPDARVGRVFWEAPKATLPSLPASYQIWLSFNVSPATVAAGSYNSQFATLLQAWNRSGRTVYWDWQHEADNPSNHFDPALIRKGWAQLLSVEKKYPSARVKSMSIYEGYLLDPNHPHGDPESWYVGADVLGFDCYVPASVPRAMAYARAKHKPWAIPEFGADNGDAGNVAYVTSTIQSWASYPPIGAAWFNNTATASFSQPLSQLPRTLAYLRVLAQPVARRLTTVTAVLQKGSPDIVRAHLTYGTATTYGTTPVYGGAVTLWQHNASTSTWTAVATVKTDRNGWAYVGVRPKYWTAYHWTFGGAATLYGTTSLTVTTG